MKNVNEKTNKEMVDEVMGREIVDEFFKTLDKITGEKKEKVTDHGKAFFAAQGWEVVE